MFTMELVIKNIVYGFLMNGPESYIKNPWNDMDFVIVLFSLVSMALSGVDLGAIKILRTLSIETT